MHKKLVAVMTALCCITSMGASLNYVYAVGESDVGMSAQSEDAASSVHSFNIAVDGSVSNSSLLKMTFKLYNHHHVFQRDFEIIDSDYGVGFDINDEDTLGPNGNIWYVEIGGAGVTPNISILGAMTGHPRQVPIDVSQSRCIIQIEDKNVKPMIGAVKATHPVIDTDLTDSQLKTIKFEAHNSFGVPVSSFTGLDVKNGKASISVAEGDIGEGYIRVVNDDIIDANGWYVPRVYWNEDNLDIKLTAKSAYSDSSVYEKPIEVYMPDLTDKQLSQTLFKVYDTEGNVCGSFTGLDAKNNTPYSSVSFTGKDSKATAKGGVRRIVCETYGEAKDKVYCEETQFYVHPDTTTKPVIVRCTSKGNTGLAPAVAGIKVKLTTNITGKYLNYLSYDVKDAFGRLVTNLKATDLVAGKGVIPYKVGDIGNWTIVPKETADISTSIQEYSFAIDDKNTVSNGIDFKDNVDVYNISMSFPKEILDEDINAYISGVLKRYDVGIEVYTADNELIHSVKAYDALEIGTKNNREYKINIPNVIMNKQVDKTLTFKLVNMPSFLTNRDDSPFEDVKLDFVNHRMADTMSWFEEMYYERKINIRTSGKHFIHVYKDKNAYNAKDDCESGYTKTTSGNLYMDTVYAPIGQDVVIEDANLESTITIDTGKSNGVIFISSFSKYKLKVEYEYEGNIDSFTLGEGDNFIKEASDNTWKSKTQFGDNIYNAIGGHTLIVTVTDGNGNNVDYYWTPDDKTDSIGLLVNKDYRDNHKFNMYEYNDFKEFLMGKSDSLMTQYPERGIIFDKNRDDKLDVFDSIMARRELIEQKSSDK